MNFFKTTVASLLLLGTVASAGTFEQNGVKEGNNKVSVNIQSFIISDDKADTINLNAQFGHFFTNDIEVIFDIYARGANGKGTNSSGNKNKPYSVYWLSPGINYYFLKNPTLTPYIGTQVFFYNLSGDNVDPTYGNRFYLGANKFLNENTAITPEIGSEFFEGDTYLHSYLKVYLSYFF